MKNSYTITSNGTSGPHVHHGGELTVQAKGTWSGGTLSIQVDIGAGFTQVESFTADEERVLYGVRPGTRVQYVMSGASSPSLSLVSRS